MISLKHLLYTIKQTAKRIKLQIYRNTIGKIIYKHALKELQLLPYIPINKLPNIDFKTLMPYKTSKSILEIGTGNGEHLIHIAQKNKNVTVIGIEMAKKYFIKTYKRIQKNLIRNAKVIYGEAIEILKYYVKNNYFDQIIMICPDPWPKKKHKKRRMVFIDNFKIIHNKIAHNGSFLLVTDNIEFAQTLLETLKYMELTYQYQEVQSDKITDYVYPTKYIKKWIKQDKKFYIISYQKNNVTN